jgi:hypothetical protein
MGGGRPLAGGARGHRESEEAAVLRGATLNTAAQRASIRRRLAALGVEAQLGPTIADAKAAPTDEVAKFTLAKKEVLLTPGFESSDVKARLGHYRQSAVALANLAGVLWVPRESAATRLAIAIARRLARAHGGDVQAANDPGGGARATLTLPCG